MDHGGMSNGGDSGDDLPPGRERRPRIAPLYHQIYLHLRQRLTEGAFSPAEPLPSEPALAEQFKVSRVTVRTTLKHLEREGLIRRVRGVGTFPVPPTRDPGKSNILGLDNLISFERGSTGVNLAWEEAPPPEEMMEFTGEGPCLRIVRVRKYNGQPISLATIHVPQMHVHHLDPAASADEPIVHVLQSRGVVADRAEQIITAVAASDLAAEELEVPHGAPLICMRRLMFTREREVVLHQESLYAPDRFEYRMTVTRASIGTAARWTPVG